MNERFCEVILSYVHVVKYDALHKIRPFYYYIYTEVNEVVFEVIFVSSSLLHLLLFKQRKRRIILHSAILVVATLHHQFALQ